MCTVSFTVGGALFWVSTPNKRTATALRILLPNARLWLNWGSRPILLK